MNGWGMLVGGVLVAGVAVVIWQGFSSDPPSQGHSMVLPDTSKIAEGDSIEDVRLPSSLSPEAKMGKRMFEEKCAACHGGTAGGLNSVAPPLVHKIYEPSHHADEAFQRAAKNGVRAHHWRFGDMPPVAGLTRGDVKFITSYVRELQRENGIN